MKRTYPLRHAINIGKQEKIMQVVKVYRELAQKLAALQWKRFFQSGSFDKNEDIKAVKTQLSERYKQTCQYQVVPVLNSFISNRQNDFVSIVYRSSLNDDTKRKLFLINKYQRWFSNGTAIYFYDKEGKVIPEKTVEIEKETMKLARAIFKHILRKHRKPSFKHCNLNLDNKVARVRPKQKIIQKKKQQTVDKTAKSFDYWIAFSTLEFRKMIHLPLISNRYFEDKEGIINKFCQINVRKSGEIQVCLIKDIEKRPYVPLTPKISLDFGLRNLFATDTGDLYGRNFINTLRKYDEYISSLASNRQRQGLNVKSPSYQNLVSNLTNFLKNEIHRVLNNIVDHYGPKEIVVEKLCFSSPNLSRRLNRILSNAGRSIIRKKFAALSEEYNIIITEVPAPYTSKECSLCHYVDNRLEQSIFVCRNCNRKVHADVNGARCISERSSHEVLNDIYLSKSAILKILVLEFLESCSALYNFIPEVVENNAYFTPYLRRNNKYPRDGDS